MYLHPGIREVFLSVILVSHYAAAHTPNSPVHLYVELLLLVHAGSKLLLSRNTSDYEAGAGSTLALQGSTTAPAVFTKFIQNKLATSMNLFSCLNKSLDHFDVKVRLKKRFKKVETV